MSIYAPQPGGLAFSVCSYFRNNEDEELSAADIALKFDTPKDLVYASLTPALKAELLARPRPGTYRAGPQLAAWNPQPVGSTAPAVDGSGRGGRKSPSSIDPLAVELIDDRPIPEPTKPGVRVSPYQLLYNRMKPGQSCDFTRTQAMSFKAWAKRANVPLEVRQISIGKFGCWKPAATPPPAPEARSKAAAAPIAPPAHSGKAKTR